VAPGMRKIKSACTPSARTPCRRLLQERAHRRRCGRRLRCGLGRREPSRMFWATPSRT